MKLKSFLKKVGIAAGTVALVIAGAAMFSAFEAHVINVTARIENAISVPQELTGLDFGTVFPQEQLVKNFTLTLSDSFFAQAGGSTTNLLVNGDFETPIVVNGAQWDIFPEGTPGLGWNVRWELGQPTTFGPGPTSQPLVANLELHRGVAGWLSQNGSQHAELDTDWDGPSGPLNGEPALVNIYQDIPTIAGQKYLLSYYYSPRPGELSTNNTLKVRINGVEIDSHTDNGGGQTFWTLFSNLVTATGPTTRVEFAAGDTPDSLGVFLDNVSFASQGRVGEVTYQVRQKPKCGIPIPHTDPVQYSGFVQVTDGPGGTFVCPLVDQPQGQPVQSVALPLLCPYLSKHETTKDGAAPENDINTVDGGAHVIDGINAFHGLPGPWTQATTLATQVVGALSHPLGDDSDTWNVDLKVPAFEGFAAQDWGEFVASFNPNADPNAYLIGPADEHQIFGCDLWVEVTGINNGQPQ